MQRLLHGAELETRILTPVASRYDYQGVGPRYTSPMLFHARVEVLPATEYRYCLVSGSERSRWRQIRSPPAPGIGSLRLAVLGDLGQTEHSVATCADIAKSHAANALDAAVLLGDLSYADNDPLRWDSFGRLFDESNCSAVPWLVLPGNHEAEEINQLTGERFLSYRSRWKTPEVHPEVAAGMRYDFGGSFYSVRMGSAHVIALNPYTDAGVGSAQFAWLEAELARVSRNVSTQILIFTHAPWYHSSTKHQVALEPETRLQKEASERLLVDYGVDFVFAGHVHAYERWVPVGGVQYIVAGHAGNREGLYNDWTSPSPYSAYRSGDHYGWGILQLSDQHSVWEVRRSDRGDVVDSLSAPARNPRATTSLVGRTRSTKSTTHQSSEASRASTRTSTIAPMGIANIANTDRIFSSESTTMFGLNVTMSNGSSAAVQEDTAKYGSNDGSPHSDPIVVVTVVIILISALLFILVCIRIFCFGFHQSKRNLKVNKGFGKLQEPKEDSELNRVLGVSSA